MPTWTDHLDHSKGHMHLTPTVPSPWIRPKLQKRKTEAIILFNGAASKEIQRQIKIDFDSVIPVRVRSAGKNITVDMRCVDF